MTEVINLKKFTVCYRFPDVLLHSMGLEGPDGLLPALNHLEPRCEGLMFSSADVPFTLLGTLNLP